MSEKIVIENFGPIKRVELDLRRVNIFIGDQGTGKSTAAKLIVAIKNSCFREILDFRYEEGINKDYQLFQAHLKLLGIENYLLEDTKIYYGDSFFTFTCDKKIVTLFRSSDIPFHTAILYDFGYIPSERSQIISLADNLFALMQTGTELPKLFLRFGDKFLQARKEKSTYDFKDIVGVIYKHKKDYDVVVLNNGKEIPVTDSSSGQHSAITLLIFFDYVCETSDSKNTIVIEEPELNLFPESQNKLLKYIFKNIKKTDRKSVIITTHSPYVLTTLNNLMYAYEVGQKEPEEASRILPKEYWINPDDVSAYRLMPDGTCKNIIEKTEDGTLIAADEIDEVSRTINHDFDELIRVDMLNEEKK